MNNHRRPSESLLFLTVLFIVFSVSAAAADAARPVLVSRYRDPASGAHAFAITPDIAQSLPSRFVKETLPGGLKTSPMFYLYPKPYTSTKPLYCFHAANGSIIFAATQDERSALASRGLREDSDPVYVYEHRVEGTAEIFRAHGGETYD